MLLGTAGARDEIIFSTAPTQTPEKTITLYTPLLNYLSQVAGEQFVIKPAKNYLEYNNGTLQNAYDMVFDGPHYTGWRMERQGAVPVARLPGSITSVAALPAPDIGQQALADICGDGIPTLAGGATSPVTSGGGLAKVNPTDHKGQAPGHRAARITGNTVGHALCEWCMGEKIVLRIDARTNSRKSRHRASPSTR